MWKKKEEYRDDWLKEVDFREVLGGGNLFMLEGLKHISQHSKGTVSKWWCGRCE